ncbi:hypothetical protein Tco_1250365, partial [Tanacetum coccineum]
SAGFNTDVIMDAKILPSIGEASCNLPDVSDMQQHVLEVVRVHDIQQNVCDVARPIRKCKTVCSQVSVEEFEGGRVYKGVGTSNPGGNVNVENLRTNVNRSARPSNLVLNVMPNPGYGSTSTSPYVSWIEEHYHMLVTNNTELYNRVEKLSSAKAVVECQVNEFKGKLLTCELDVARQKKEVERLVRKKKEVEFSEIADVPCSWDGVAFHVGEGDEVTNFEVAVLHSCVVISFGLPFVSCAS